jgi:hypothetical protein
MDTYWDLVDEARSGVADPVEDADRVAARLVDLLAECPVPEILQAEVRFQELQRRSYRWDLWAAAYLIRGGCSDDGFDYFRGWLVMQGRRAWEAAVADPDSLADTVRSSETFAECEDALAVAGDAHARATGDRDGFWPAWEAVPGARASLPADDPVGEQWDFDDDDVMRVRLPRLSALCLDTGDDEDD